MTQSLYYIDDCHYYYFLRTDKDIATVYKRNRPMKMVRHYKRKTERAAKSIESLQTAARLAEEDQNIITAVRLQEVDRMTLARYI